MSATAFTSARVRREFQEFFREKGHTLVPSASIVPQGDPTLLFINAGMNPFKDVFLGTGTRPYTRVANTQKCLRVSGKHNDLEEVGHDTYHHTLFEMLGNWSFGDYFKREAIAWAWELLVERWGLDPSRLYATVHEGDARLGLAPDDEAADLWREVTSIPHDHIKYCRSKDNFWMMGDTGPCGPCSEIHIDLRSDEERARVPGIDLVNSDDPTVMEIWNLVFIQYNALADGTLEPLKSRHVDTGMGFERILSVLQKKSSNYDTDLFTRILSRLAELTPREGVAGYDAISLPPAETERVRIAMRVVADHIRTLAFTIADGVLPGNTGRGYVIRRILRRAVRYGYQTLGFRTPFLCELVAPLAETMGEAFPELVAQRAHAERVIRAEEESFLETLGLGLASFATLVPHLAAFTQQPEAALEALRADRSAMDLLSKSYPGLDLREAAQRFAEGAAQRKLSGELTFLLHDTYGFPPDLTALLAREEGYAVDMAGYEACMAQQKARARAAQAFKVDLSRAEGWTERKSAEGRFVGYTTLKTTTEILAARSVALPNGEVQHQLVLAESPFYSESGGQVADTGHLIVDGTPIRVLDARKAADRAFLVVEALPEDLDAPVVAEVDAARRQAIARHHTATHLLHAGLRTLLGAHVAQKGSLVAPDRLRFDFSHYERVDSAALRDLEQWVNAFILENVAGHIETDVPLAEAQSRGAMALFGEKYGERVRVVTFDPARSVELCGGTHVAATGEVGLFRFLSESSVAAGVRRIEAVCGMEALALLQREGAELERARALFKASQKPLDDEISALLERLRTAEKEASEAKMAVLSARAEQFLTTVQEIGNAKLVQGQIDGADADALRTLAHTLQQKAGPDSLVYLAGKDASGEKAVLVVAAGDAVQKHLQAGKMVGALAKLVEGGGGGRPNIATAGGKNPARLAETFAVLPKLVAEAVVS